MKEVPGGVTAAKGFRAAGMHCGIRKNTEKKDLALIFSDVPCSAAAVYTTNLVKASPLYVTMRHLENGALRAVIANSGNANACAPGGEDAALRACAAAAAALGIAKEDVAVASTGVIGVPLPVGAIEDAAKPLAAKLSESGSDDAAEAIMTTDLTKKSIAVSFSLGGKTVTLGGIAKGSGMIHPNMGTMLSFLTTDARISADMLQAALRESARVTYNRISVDGDTSTNDMNLIMASGLAGNAEITEPGADYGVFLAALNRVNGFLAREMARDGEGATKLITCRVTGAGDTLAAERLAKSVIASSLVKTAMFGADANWGRVLCAMGYSGAAFDPAGVSISFASDSGEVQVCQNGMGLAFDEVKAKEILTKSEVTIICSLGQGGGEAEAFGCDLSYDYVKINGDYRT
ncbi:MAG: bifunctional glutamate N-acetyltransferase/amino-acid acetyltransferase ArgJ [Oscillospiraceae bacterium]|jgi:glutamate N-acetyltransferase/amino-acid N-acetyltransferase|nr:bifunctional glutamate N-acetyltransferase/amino-acid acetyltransferase ArgJ [Oscillospiraceae bacterium]